MRYPTLRCRNCRQSYLLHAQDKCLYAPTKFEVWDCASPLCSRPRQGYGNPLRIGDTIVRTPGSKEPLDYHIACYHKLFTGVRYVVLYDALDP